MNISNKIAHISLEHFSKLPKTGKPTDKQWTILSTIVKENTETEKFEVVALGTGSKCIGKNQMSELGDILNDSHGEIICRRSFLKYLYFQINECISGNFSDVVQFCTGSKEVSLKSSTNFHFFTTHVPCGDAAIFPKCTTEDSGQIVNIRKRANEDTDETAQKKIKINNDDYIDICRTGAKCLKESDIQDPQENGVNFHAIGQIRTKPGRGDPTLSVSCSDKIAKWSHLGVQGALLSLLFNKPIYLKSFIILGKTFYSKDALTRALHTRFDNVKLCEPFHKHDLEIHQSELTFEFEKINTKIPCPSSISWWKGTKKIEVAIDGKKQGVTKKKKNSKESRLSICKIELMRDFLQIAKILKLTDVIPSLQYNELKATSVRYQNAWSIVKSDIFKVYTSKDLKLLQFKVD